MRIRIGWRCCDRCFSLGIDERAVLERDVLTAAQLREMAADPLVTIGSHGVAPPASLMTDEEMRAELVSADSASRVAGHAGAPPRVLYIWRA
jgi:hypothetical protein